jgi:cyanophycin synthetase
MADPVELVELRVLDGPNLYFPRPAVKVTIAAPGWMRAPTEKVEEVARRLGMRARHGGDPQSEHRRRFTARVAKRLVGRGAAAPTTTRARR